MLRSRFKLARKFLLISFLLLDFVAILNGPIGRRVMPVRQGHCRLAVGDH